MNDVLKKQFEWYEANLESLLRDYRGKYIAFSENGVPNRFVIPKVTVTESDLTDCDALIGMDIITLGDMIVSNNPNTRFSFRIPSEGVPGFTSAHEVAR